MEADYLFQRWYEGKAPTQQFQQRAGLPLWQLTKDQRRAKFAIWENEIRGPQRERIVLIVKNLREIMEQIEELRSVDRERVLASAEIIACTTWGASRYSDLLLKQRLPVFLAEEAGEILEAHILAALTPKCEHLILIGDHKQLRPKVEHYPLQKESEKGYNLNVSLFERLVDTLQCATLKVCSACILADCASICSPPRLRSEHS